MRHMWLLLVALFGCATAGDREGIPPYTGDLRADFDMIRAEYKLGVYDCTDQAQVLRDYLLDRGVLEYPTELAFVRGVAKEPVVWHTREGARLPDHTHVWLEYWHRVITEVRSGPLRLVTEARVYIVYDPLRDVLGQERTNYYLTDNLECWGVGGMVKRGIIRARADLVLKEKTDFGYRAIGDRYWRGRWWSRRETNSGERYWVLRDE